MVYVCRNGPFRIVIEFNTLARCVPTFIYVLLQNAIKKTLKSALRTQHFRTKSSSA